MYVINSLLYYFEGSILNNRKYFSFKSVYIALENYHMAKLVQPNESNVTR